MNQVGSIPILIISGGNDEWCRCMHSSRPRVGTHARSPRRPPNPDPRAHPKTKKSLQPESPRFHLHPSSARDTFTRPHATSTPHSSSAGRFLPFARSSPLQRDGTASHPFASGSSSCSPRSCRLAARHRSAQRSRHPTTSIRPQPLDHYLERRRRLPESC